MNRHGFLWLVPVSLLVAAPEAAWQDAVLGMRSDATGGVWNFQENGELGRVGASAVNRGQMLLVNGEAFAAQSAYMTGDGNEFLVSGQAGRAADSLILVRRIRLDPVAGVVRYAELLRNEGRETRSVQVELRTNLNGYYQRFLSSRGRETPVALEGDETGFWLAPEAVREGGKGYAFALFSPGAPSKPVLGSRQSYLVSAHFDLDIAPGETAGLLHAIRQTPLDAGADAARLAGQFAPMNLETIRDSLPRALRGCLRNVSPGPVTAAAPFFREPPGAARGHDVVALRDGGELLGSLRPGRLHLETARGRLELDAADLIAAVPGPAGKREVELWLRDGEVTKGTEPAEPLTFALAAGGAAFPLRWDGLIHLRRNQPPAALDRSVPWVETMQGERLRLGAGWNEAPGRWNSACGPLDLPLTEVRSLRQTGGGLRLELRDGTRVTVLGAAPDASVPLGGRFEGGSLPLAEIRALWQPGQAPDSKASPPLTGWAETVETDRLAWRAGTERLELNTAQGPIQVPLAEVRRMERENGGNGFRIILWDGSQFSAHPGKSNALSLQGACRWSVPWDRLKALGGDPAPAAAKQQLALDAALQSLRADDWKTRYQAEQTLRELGSLVIPRLREAETEGDVDFRHRVRWLLEELETQDAEPP